MLSIRTNKEIITNGIKLDAYALYPVISVIKRLGEYEVLLKEDCIITISEDDVEIFGDLDKITVQHWKPFVPPKNVTVLKEKNEKKQAYLEQNEEGF